LTKKAFIAALFTWLIILSAGYAALPMYEKSYPAFSASPTSVSSLALTHKELIFKVDEQDKRQARITAHYTLFNALSEDLTIPVILPYIAEGTEGPGAEILFNDQAVEYKIYGAGNLDRYSNCGDYLKEPDGFKDLVNIDNIINHLNRPAYQPIHFDDQAETSLYEITFNPPYNRQASFSFSLDKEKTRVLTFGLPIIFGDPKNSKVTAARDITEKDIGEKAYLLILGEDTVTNIQGSHNDTISKSMVEGGDYIRKNLKGLQQDWSGLHHRDFGDFYEMTIRQIDSLPDVLSVTSMEATLRETVNHNNICVISFELDFPAGNTKTLSLAYPVQAFMDRWEARDYVKTFASLFDPSRRFSECGGIDICIELSPAHPFIIESSLPLFEIEPGVYRMSLNSLPQEDLVFSTYSPEQVTPIDRMLHRSTSYLKSYGHFAIFCTILVSTALIVMVTLAFLKRKMKG